MLREQVERAVSHIRSMGGTVPRTALVLGSGLGTFAESLPHPVVIPTKAIPHYPVATVEGHKGELVFSHAFSQTVLAFRGRVHLYESGDPQTVLFPISVAARLGARNLIITNAAGGINRQFLPGDLMLITDQIDLTAEQIPMGPASYPSSGPDVYDKGYAALAEAAAGELGVPLRKGIYAGVKGPSYETAAEIEMIYRLGGDAVGMSTVLETRLARHLGMRILGISCITNKATGTSPSKLSHAEVTEVANRVRDRFARLLTRILEGLAVDEA